MFVRPDNPLNIAAPREAEQQPSSPIGPCPRISEITLLMELSPAGLVSLDRDRSITGYDHVVGLIQRAEAKENSTAVKWHASEIRVNLKLRNSAC